MIKSILLSLYQSIMFSTNEIYHIDLKLSNVGNPEMKATGIIGMVTGLSIITAGVILESNRIARNQPDFVISIGGTISIGSVWYYIKGCK